MLRIKMFLFCDCPRLHRHSFICTRHNTVKLALIHFYLHNGTSLAPDREGGYFGVEVKEKFQGRGESKPKKSLGLPNNQKKILVQKSTPQNPVLNFGGVKVFNKGLKLVIYPNS